MIEMYNIKSKLKGNNDTSREHLILSIKCI